MHTKRTTEGLCLELAGVAETATEAMAAFESYRPDVVILDRVLRAGSGLDVLHEIKQRTPACRVLVFTGYDAEPYRTRSLAAGADCFFSKNGQHRELIQQLHDFGGDAPAATGRPTRVPPTPQTFRNYEGHVATLTTTSRSRARRRRQIDRKRRAVVPACRHRRKEGPMITERVLFAQTDLNARQNSSFEAAQQEMQWTN